ncbi:MAG TPA: ribonuclease Z [Aquifex aeolicus]|uniref:Ribonuclease Z n=1 Tax=Aquifex aeolicus TaxID=63363 RepID=A0A9D0YQJ8_AQUAO|nr:ribonuclease Z [Aquificales bacterium]HIP86629.1 ribonuclease Z [Aquifex sp.]HIP98849.1 ribonuclease Z [Aquifex aeolicus]HIQ26537.1 ribonuclease Z [Aquifex aeolicus]
MKGFFTILGTSSAIPAKDRNHPAIFFQYQGEAFLFDCGEGTQRQIQIAGHSFYKIGKIFITHLHGDHVLGLPGLLQTLDFHDKPFVEIYGPPGIKRLIELSTTQCFYINTQELKVEVKEIKPTDEIVTVLETDNYRIKTIGLDHTVDCLGYAFEEREKFKYDSKKVKELHLKPQHFKELEILGYTTVGGKEIFKSQLGELKKGFKFVYITDTYYTENIFKLTQSADYLVLECTYFDEEEYAREAKHLSFNIFREKIYPKLLELGVKKIILTHFSRRYKDLSLFEEEIKNLKMENVVIARDLLNFTF